MQTFPLLSKNVTAILIFLLGFTFVGQSLATEKKEASQQLLTHNYSWKNNTMEGQPSLRGSAIIDNSLWVTGTNNSVFVSQDGGETWEKKSVNGKAKTDFRDIALFDKNTAIVMGVGSGESSVLYKTTDGGEHWELLLQNEDEKGFFDSIGFWNKSEGLLLGDPVGGFYVVKKTNDGGKTWRRIQENKLPKITEKEAAFAASGNTLIVAKNGKAYITTGGFSASVYVSHDYGESWQRQTIPLFNQTQTAGGYGLGLNATQQLFVLGGDYKDRAGKYANIATLKNNQWQKVKSHENGLRTAMSCLQLTCIATGKTSSDISFDGGITWQLFLNQQAEKGSQGFYTLAADNHTFIAAGAKGSVGVIHIEQ